MLSLCLYTAAFIDITSLALGPSLRYSVKDLLLVSVCIIVCFMIQSFTLIPEPTPSIADIANPLWLLSNKISSPYLPDPVTLRSPVIYPVLLTYKFSPKNVLPPVTWRTPLTSRSSCIVVLPEISTLPETSRSLKILKSPRT